jgi:hypothetical protein
MKMGQEDKNLMDILTLGLRMVQKLMMMTRLLKMEKEQLVATLLTHKVNKFSKIK